MEDDIHFHKSWKFMIKPVKSCLDDIDLLYLVIIIIYLK